MLARYLRSQPQRYAMDPELMGAIRNYIAIHNRARGLGELHTRAMPYMGDAYAQEPRLPQIMQSLQQTDDPGDLMAYLGALEDIGHQHNAGNLMHPVTQLLRHLGHANHMMQAALRGEGTAHEVIPRGYGSAAMNNPRIAQYLIGQLGGRSGSPLADMFPYPGMVQLLGRLHDENRGLHQQYGPALYNAGQAGSLPALLTLHDLSQRAFDTAAHPTTRSMAARAVGDTQRTLTHMHNDILGHLGVTGALPTGV